MARIAATSPAPERLRFIVVMRDPIMRAFSEWSMFALGWNWDGQKNFTISMEHKVWTHRSPCCHTARTFFV
eukprot:5429091-Pleurochrysis_carterae.AAC.1